MVLRHLPLNVTDQINSILVLVKQCALLILSCCVCCFIFYSVQSFSIEVPSIFLHLAFIIIYFTFKVLVFLFQSLAKGSDIFWTESLYAPGQISSTPIYCPQPGSFCLAAAFIPFSRYVPSQNLFLTTLHHRVLAFRIRSFF